MGGSIQCSPGRPPPRQCLQAPPGPRSGCFPGAWGGWGGGDQGHVLSEWPGLGSWPPPALKCLCLRFLDNHNIITMILITARLTVPAVQGPRGPAKSARTQPGAPCRHRAPPDKCQTWLLCSVGGADSSPPFASTSVPPSPPSICLVPVPPAAQSGPAPPRGSLADARGRDASSRGSSPACLRFTTPPPSPGSVPAGRPVRCGDIPGCQQAGPPHRRPADLAAPREGLALRKSLCPQRPALRSPTCLEHPLSQETTVSFQRSESGAPAAGKSAAAAPGERPAC